MLLIVCVECIFPDQRKTIIEGNVRQTHAEHRARYKVNSTAYIGLGNIER
jgi:hypothetical protein